MMASFRETYLVRPSVRRVRDNDYAHAVLVAGPLHLTLERELRVGSPELTVHLWIGPFGIHVWPYRYPMNRNAVPADGVTVVWDYLPHGRSRELADR
jgi:hypothetical protein